MPLSVDTLAHTKNLTHRRDKLMNLPLRTLLASAALFTAFGPLASVHAQAVTEPDPATAAAIAQWRSGALAHVDPASRDALAALYADQPVADAAAANNAAGAKVQAEQAAWAELDKTSQALIQKYFAEVNADESDGVATLRESELS